MKCVDKKKRKMWREIILLVLLFHQLKIFYGYNSFHYKIPEYCSHDMSNRNIPSLENDDFNEIANNNNLKIQNLQLKQVQVLIRHGARTPYTAHACWKGYNIKWSNCNITEIMEVSRRSSSQSQSPSPRKRDEGSDDDSDDDDRMTWRFRLLYDAYSNQLGGNCLTGQLITQGYQQEVLNGQILKAAYIGSDNLKLFNTSVWDDLNQDLIYLRSDDEQRTLMSGQILVHSMFDLHHSEIIDWHTGDYILDTLSPNSKICPILEEIETESMNSLEYQQKLNSESVKQLQKSLNSILGSESAQEWSWRYLQDCLMTTLCSGKSSELPVGLTQELVDDAVHHIEYMYAYKSLFNRSEFSKLAMANTAYKIRSRLEKMIQSEETALKFVLYAGHDTTLSAILAAILGTAWDQKWPPYASLLTIELYQRRDAPDQHYFRVIYNGNALVIPGCASSLCEINYLLSALSFGRDGHIPQCFSKKQNPVNTSSDVEDERVYETILFTTGEWMLVTTFLSILSSLFGALLYMTASSKQNERVRRKKSLVHLQSYDRVPAHEQL